MTGTHRRFQGKARSKRDGSMSSLEKAYAVVLGGWLGEGRILRWDFQPERFRLADMAFYTPDFRLVMADERVEFHETKGYLGDRASALRFKLAAELHPYTFVLVTRATKKNGGAWSWQRAEGDDERGARAVEAVTA